MNQGIIMSTNQQGAFLKSLAMAAVAVLWSVTGLFAQNTSSQMWYTYNHQAIVSKKWGYQFDLNHRTANFKNTTSVLSAARVGGTYLIDKNHRLSAGYAWFGTHVGGLDGNILNENRLWEQYLVQKPMGKTTFFHRVRLEQRWRELTPPAGAKKGATAFSFRSRYMYQHQGPIWPITQKRKFGVGWQAATEIMLHAGDGIEKHYFDQWRLVGGIVLMPSKQLNLAVLYQYINQYRPSTEQDYNIHTIRLTLLHQLDFTAHNKSKVPPPAKQ